MLLVKFPIAILVIVSLSGCWMAAAGAGAEAGYVLTQEDRSTSQVLSDQRITSTVKTRLLADPLVSGFAINVDTYKGQVSLKGIVSSAKELNKALEIAAGVEGVVKTKSQLHIEP